MVKACAFLMPIGMVRLFHENEGNLSANPLNINKKKTLKYFSFAWLLLAATSLLVACGGDDDVNTNGSSPGSDTGNTNMVDAVVTGGVTDLGSSSVTIYGYVNHDDPQAILGMGIVYGTDRDATKLAATGKKATATSFDPGTNNRRFSVKISGLSSSTTYYYYAYAGQKTANDIQSFTTKSFCSDADHPHWIDLGLPSGTQWRCCNEGASTPEAYGGYYTFGQVSSAPSLDQIEELLSNTTSEWTAQNGVNGRKFTGPNGGTIFLPAAGSRVYGDLFSEGSDGSYWSSTLDESDPRRAYLLGFGRGDARWYDPDYHGLGFTVRPVR